MTVDIEQNFKNLGEAFGKVVKKHRHSVDSPDTMRKQLKKIKKDDLIGMYLLLLQQFKNTDIKLGQEQRNCEKLKSWETKFVKIERRFDHHKDANSSLLKTVNETELELFNDQHGREFYDPTACETKRLEPIESDYKAMFYKLLGFVKAHSKIVDTY